MSSLYAESSAVLALLHGESRGKDVVRCLQPAVLVVTSALTFVECDRAFFRSVALSGGARSIDRLRAALAVLENRWNVMPLNQGTIDRARQAFPFEPIRALDALHVASAVTARMAMPGLEFLSLDDRVRKVAVALGFNVLPA